jgi:hypothetical protein
MNNNYYLYFVKNNKEIERKTHLDILNIILKYSFLLTSNKNITKNEYEHISSKIDLLNNNIKIIQIPRIIYDLFNIYSYQTNTIIYSRTDDDINLDQLYIKNIDNIINLNNFIVNFLINEKYNLLKLNIIDYKKIMVTLINLIDDDNLKELNLFENILINDIYQTNDFPKYLSLFGSVEKQNDSLKSSIIFNLSIFNGYLKNKNIDNYCGTKYLIEKKNNINITTIHPYLQLYLSKELSSFKITVLDLLEQHNMTENLL